MNRYLPASLSTFLLLGCGAAADPPGADPSVQSLAVRPAQCDRSGGTIVGGDIVLLPPCPQATPGLGIGQNGRHVLFANFDGVDVRGGDTSLENQGIRNGMAMLPDVIQIAPYAPVQPNRYDTILKIRQKVADFYADFNIDVVISRPLSGDYTMTVVGDHETVIGLDPPIVGISPGDCKNSSSTNLNYAFSASLRENPDQTAVTIAHEAGHSFGLGHTLNTDDIMYPSVTDAKGFLTGVARDAGPCGLRPNVDVQDGHQVLLDNLGARPPGLEKPGKSPPPTVRIITPEEGATLGRDVTIAVAATTEARGGIDHVTLSLSRAEDGKFRGSHPVAELRPPSSAAQIRMSAPGNYQLIATAYDQFGNLALTRSQFTVATITCGEPNDCAPGQKCLNNVCLTPTLPDKPPTGKPEDALRPIGTACDITTECKSGFCAVTPVGQICTHYCNAERICDGGLDCVDGICQPQMWSRATPKLGQVGGKCSRKEDCFSGECSPFIDAKTPRYCTRGCDPEAAWSCPSSMSCTMADTATGMRSICQVKPITPPAAEDSGNSGGGGCTLSPASRTASDAGLALALIMLSGMLVLRRRIYS